jgi:hypothetical protein
VINEIFRVFLALCVCVFAQNLVNAQDQQSHRLLTSPDENGLTKSRLELFRRLQGLIDQAKTHANSPDAKPLDAATFEALQRVLRDFQQDSPPADDPNTRPLLPPGLNPENPGENPLPGELDPARIDPQTGQPTQPGQRPGQRPGTRPTPRNGNTQPRALPPMSDEDRKRLQSLFPELLDQDNGQNTRQNPSNNTQPRPNTVPGKRPFRPNDEPIITSDDPESRIRNGSNPRPNNPNRQSDPSRRTTYDRNANQPNRNGANAQRGSNQQTLQEQIRILNAAMERMRQEQRRNGNNSLDVGRNVQNPNNRTNPNRVNSNDPNRPNPNVLTAEQLQNLIQRRQELANTDPATRPNNNRRNQNQADNRSNDPNDLSNMSIDDRMLTILERARRRVRANAEADRNARAQNPTTGNSPDDGSAADSSEPSGWEATLSGVLQRAVERATREAPPERPDRNSRRNRPPTRRAAQRDDDSDSWFSRTSEATGNMFMDLTNGESQTRTSGSGPAFGSGGGSFPVVPVLLILGIAGVVFWMMRHSEQARQLAAVGSTNHPAMPVNVTSREEIVQAFHAITSRTPQVASDSWTHRKAAAAMIEAKPANEFDVETLADVYEEARYQPEDAHFTDDQIVKARRAVERWNS